MLLRIMTKAALVAFACSMSLAAHAVADDVKRDINVPAGELATALQILAKQSGVEFISHTDQLDGFRTNGVNGTLSARDAAAQLLKGTPFTVKDIDGALLIMLPTAVPSSDNSASAPRTPSPAQAATPAEQEAPQSFWKKFRFANVVKNAGATSEGGASADESGELTKPKLEEVVVTAQKRIERLIEVPQSVTVLSADDLARSGAVQLRDFAVQVPGLTFTTAGAGYTQVSLRGVTTGQDISSTVAIYVDDVPFGSSSAYVQGGQTALDVGLFDMARIEVLRGPQGTLYGSASMGGLIKYVSRRPDLNNYSGQGQTSISTTENGGTGYNASAAVNAPLVPGSAGMRISGYYSHDGGHTANVIARRSDVNRSDVYGGRLDFLAVPADGLNVRLTAFLQNIDRDGQATADFLLSGAPETGSLVQSRFVPEPFTQEFSLYSGMIDYQLGNLTLASISSYQIVASDVSYDVTRQQLRTLTNPPFSRAYSAVGLNQELRTRKFTQEFRVGSGEQTSVTWLLGGFYTDETSSNRQLFDPRDVSGNPAVNDLFNFFAPTKYAEYAAFGNVTFRLSRALDVSGGLRYARNEQEFSQIGSGLFAGSRPQRSTNEDVVTYLANARYRFSERSIAYARFATGYRPGGPNGVLNDPVTGLPQAPTSFDSDSLKSYEVGFKTQGTLSVDASLYYIDWSDIQVIALRNGFSIRANAGAASVKGAETSITARPLTGLTLNAALAYQDAELAEAAPDLRARKGERLPNVPRFTGAVGIDYQLTNFRLLPSFGATVRHVSERRASFDGSVSFPQYRLPAHTSVDLRAAALVEPVTLSLRE